MASFDRRNIQRPPYQLQFPIPLPPLCRDCGHATSRDQVSQSNQIGNAGRWYYKCETCKSKMLTRGERLMVGWSTWDDDQGINDLHPRCRCGLPSRLDHKRNGGRFYTCSTGSCRYYLNGDDSFTGVPNSCADVDSRSFDKWGRTDMYREQYISEDTAPLSPDTSMGAESFGGRHVSRIGTRRVDNHTTAKSISEGCISENSSPRPSDKDVETGIHRGDFWGRCIAPLLCCG